MPSSDTPHRREIECRGEAAKGGLSQDDERRDAREEDDHSGRSNARVSTPTPRLAREHSAEVEQVADEASTTPAPAPVTSLVGPVALIVAPAAGVVVLALGVDEPLELATIEENETDLVKLQRWLRRVRARDLFGAWGRKAAVGAVDTAADRLEAFTAEAIAREGGETVESADSGAGESPRLKVVRNR